MATLGLEDHVVDPGVYDRTVRHLRQAQVLLPTFAELARPKTVPAAVRRALGAVGPDEAHPLNLWRVHWYNDAGRREQSAVPEHVVLAPHSPGSPPGSWWPWATGSR